MDASVKDCKPNSKLLEWLNTYKINSLQQKDIKNFIDETNKNTSKPAGILMGIYTKATFISNSQGIVLGWGIKSYFARWFSQLK